MLSFASHVRRRSTALVSIGSAAVLAMIACGADEAANPGRASSPPDGGTGVTAPTTDAAGGSSGADAAPERPPIPPQVDDTVYFGSGTRLRARIYTDGPRRVFDTFVDAEFGPCVFQPDSAGVLRCLPGQWTNSSDYEERYVDAGCTDKVLVSRPGACVIDRTYLLRDAGTCVGCYSVAELGPPLQGGAGIPLYRGTPQNCALDGIQPVTSGADLRRAVATIPPERFVAIQLAQWGTGRIQATGYRGDDGSWIYAQRFFDSQESIGCSPAYDQELTLRCFPGVDPLAYLRSDASCQTSVYKPYGAVGPWTQEFGIPSGQCGISTTKIFEVGAPYVGPLFWGLGETCAAQGTANAGDPIYTLGPQVPATRFEPLQRDVVGGGRLLRHVTTTAGGSFGGTADGSPEVLYDTVLGTDCSPALDRDGHLACVPYGAYSDTRTFSDAACTHGVAPLTSCGAAAPTYTVREPNADRCVAPRWHVHRLGPIVELPGTYALDYQNVCVPASTSPVQVQPFTGEIDPSELAPMSQVLE